MSQRIVASIGLSVIAAWLTLGNATAADLVTGTILPTDKSLTPTAATGATYQDLNPDLATAPDIRAGRAAAVSVSPDGKMLAVLTSGFNLHFARDGSPAPELSSEYVFLFDISGPQPKQQQVLPIPNSFQGLAWSPSSDSLFAAGGSDDTVQEFVHRGSVFVGARTFRLGHKVGLGLDAMPLSGALAVSPDGTRLLVANFENDSVSLVDLKSGQIVAEQDLRPGIIDPKRRGQPGGSYPRSVVWSSPNHAYVASERDREIVSLAVSGNRTRVVGRMAVHGQPVALLVNHRGNRLYAALDNTDEVAIFDTRNDALLEAFDVVAPQAVYANPQKVGGADSNALALTPDEGTLLVSNGGENAVAVVRLSDRALGDGHRRAGDDDDTADRDHSAVVGLVPTGWYPTGVATSKDGAAWYVVNGKSPTGPDTAWCRKLDDAHLCMPETPLRTNSLARNGYYTLSANDQHILQVQKAGLLSFPAPSPLDLARLTKQVALNDHLSRPETTAEDERLFSFLRQHIHHVIYVVKENRTYDQILGDLEIGNGDPRLAIFPERISPNHHAIARTFSTLDNFRVSGEGSWTGWEWAMAARTNDFAERLDPVMLAGRTPGGEDSQGMNRKLNMSLATSAERHAEDPRSPSDPDILPGIRYAGALDGPDGDEGKGHVWDAALRKGLSVRNYGFLGTLQPVPRERDPFAQKLPVFFPTNAALRPLSDPYYRNWDMGFPDYWRVQEWKRELDGFSRSKAMPNLMLVKLSNDHFGNFGDAIDGVNTPETQMADNDYALGSMVEAVANSPFASDTLIITVEDDTWDGPDHVDSFRSVSLFAGPYVRQHAVVSHRYTTVNIIKTIEEILGVGPIGLNDALAAPMSDVFDPDQAAWTYKAIVPHVLRSTALPLPPDAHAQIEYPAHSAAYWVRAMAGQDFSGPDRVNPMTFNRALWRGLKGSERYPSIAKKEGN
ncbi:MAG TPA: bifunctional YncE family protein/alkaline phosphatase family protein [Rhizomicrobium sp.]|nr:bifunctional YncE family protein/alkaline phosphatase family protein [Rhizomicrobium sp.]